MKICEFRLRFHWRLFLRVRLKISEPMMVSLPTHLGVTRPRWANAPAHQQKCHYTTVLPKTTTNTNHWCVYPEGVSLLFTNLRIKFCKFVNSLMIFLWGRTMVIVLFDIRWRLCIADINPMRPSVAYVRKLTIITIIGSGNGLSRGHRQAIIWTNAGILLIGP